MPAAVNTAAQYFPQFTAPALSVNGAGATITNVQPLPCTITGILTGGSRVNVTVENHAQTPQTRSGAWAERNVPYVDTGVLPPVSGPFVTATGYVVPTNSTTHLPSGTASSGPSGSGFGGENGETIGGE